MTWRVREPVDARAAGARLVAAYRRALADVRADGLIARAVVRGDLAWRRDGGLAIAGEALAVGPRGVTVCSLGKAAVAMARGVAAVTGDAFRGGLAVSKDEPAAWAPPGVRVLYGSHPVPDDRSRRAADEVIGFVGALRPDDLLVVCVSGGASALCAAPLASGSLDELAARTAELVTSGAAIDVINRERRRLLRLAEGRLAEGTRARLATLVLADIPGCEHRTAAETAALVGAGPTVGGDGRSPGPVCVVGTPTDWQAALLRWCGRLVGVPRRATFPASADVAEVADAIAEEARAVEPQTVVCAVGEPTVRVPAEGLGRGGRAQHLALLVADRFARHAPRTRAPVALIAGSDGSDGATEVAGAVVSDATVARARAANCSADSASATFDSHRFHRAAGSLVATGPSGTNLLDGILITATCLRRRSAHQ